MDTSVNGIACLTFGAPSGIVLSLNHLVNQTSIGYWLDNPDFVPPSRHSNQVPNKLIQFF